MICQRCKTRFDAKFCPECGAPVNTAIPDPVTEQQPFQNIPSQQTQTAEPQGFQPPQYQTQQPQYQVQQPQSLYQPPKQQYPQAQTLNQQPQYQNPQAQYQNPQGQYQYQQPQMQMPNIIINNINNNHNEVSNYQSYASDKNKWVALILCFFFGYLGVHRFYTGKVGTGILYALTGGMFFFGYAIDFIKILCGSFRDKYGFYLK